VSLVDGGDETEVEDGDNNDEVDAEYMVFVDRDDVQREPLMDRVVVSSAHAAAELTERHREEELVVASAARAMANLAQANAEAAAHWKAEVEKVMAFLRAVDRRELEKLPAVVCENAMRRQEDAIEAVIAAIDRNSADQL
jgi:hypothetical protein